MSQKLIKPPHWMRGMHCRAFACEEPATKAISDIVISYTNGFTCDALPIPVCDEHARAWGRTPLGGEKPQGMQS